MSWIGLRRLAVLIVVFVAVYGAVRLTTSWSEPPGAAQEVAAVADLAQMQPANVSNSANDTAFYAAAFATLIVGAGLLLCRSGRVGPGLSGSWSARDAQYGAAMLAAHHTPGFVPGPPDCGASSGFGDCGGGF
jgi:hypothetical protein